MSIGRLANAARQSLSRGLEALQTIDAPPELFDVAQPAARAMGFLSELDLAPVARRAACAHDALQALRESLSSLQRPGRVAHPAAELGLAAVAESLGAVMQLVRELGDGLSPLPHAGDGGEA